MSMSISSLSLSLIFLTFLTTPLVLSSRTPKMAVAAGSPSIEKNLQKTHVHPPALPVSEADSSPSMAKIDAEPAPNTAISGFFRHKFPFHQGWPFHKHGPFPTAKPANPSVTTTTPATATGADKEESEKVPSSPSNGNRDGGNA